MAKTKKVDPKAVFKAKVMADVEKALTELGYDVADGTDYGMTKGTRMILGDSFDIQLKPIAPKTGLERYAKAE